MANDYFYLSFMIYDYIPMTSPCVVRGQPMLKCQSDFFGQHSIAFMTIIYCWTPIWCRSPNEVRDPSDRKTTARHDAKMALLSYQCPYEFPTNHGWLHPQLHPKTPSKSPQKTPKNRHLGDVRLLELSSLGQFGGQGAFGHELGCLHGLHWSLHRLGTNDPSMTVSGKTELAPNHPYFMVFSIK